MKETTSFNGSDDEMWFLKQKQITVGPITSEDLPAYLHAGKIVESTLVREGENGKWVCAGSLPNFLAGNAVASAEVIGIEKGMMKLRCPQCSVKYHADTDFAGETIDCLQCGARLKIPVPQTQNDDLYAMNIPEGPIVCPHCWQKFSTENLYYISSHPELSGDSVLGAEEQMRFLPTVYNASGLPLDAKGMICTDMACPRCHLRIPSTVIDAPSLYFSIVGAPASGKSYFLTSMIHKLKSSLPKFFDLAFWDADPLTNAVLSRYEQILFMSKSRDELAILPKTQQVGESFSSQVLLNNLTIDLPKPTLFLLQPTPSHPESEEGDHFPRNLIFYDNAGEHFQPGTDGIGNPATLHLPRSNGIMFLFDPTEEARLRDECDSADPQVADGHKICDQGILLAETISRIRRHHNLKASEKCKVPLMMIVGKFDVWEKNFPFPLRSLSQVVPDPGGLGYQLEMNTVMNISFNLREKLLERVPEIVNIAEAFFETVIFIPISSFGCLAQKNAAGAVGILPSKIDPVWVDTPLLVLLTLLGYIPGKRTQTEGAEPLTHYKITDNGILFSIEDSERIQLPLNYLGTTLQIGGKTVVLPSEIASDEQPEGGSDDTFWDR